MELLARGGDCRAVPFPEPLTSYRTCDFSFSGLKNSVYREIQRLEKLHGIEADALIPELRDVCASAQRALVQHLARRTQRALEFCTLQGLLPPFSPPREEEEEEGVTDEDPRSSAARREASPPTLVVAGGVACNNVIRDALAQVCSSLGATFVATPARLCSDNGVMIAWNGLERLRAGAESVAEDLDSLRVVPRCPLGEDISQSVAQASIRLEKIKLNFG